MNDTDHVNNAVSSAPLLEDAQKSSRSECQKARYTYMICAITLNCTWLVHNRIAFPDRILTFMYIDYRVRLLRYDQMHVRTH